MGFVIRLNYTSRAESLDQIASHATTNVHIAAVDWNLVTPRRPSYSIPRAPQPLHSRPSAGKCTGCTSCIHFIRYYDSIRSPIGLLLAFNCPPEADTKRSRVSESHRIRASLHLWFTLHAHTTSLRAWYGFGQGSFRRDKLVPRVAERKLERNQSNTPRVTWKRKTILQFFFSNTIFNFKCVFIILILNAIFF